MDILKVLKANFRPKFRLYASSLIVFETYMMIKPNTMKDNLTINAGRRPKSSSQDK